MKTLHAHVEGGRIVVDDRVELPDGTTLRLVMADDVDDMSPEETAQLHEALLAAWRRVQNDELEPIDGLLEELQARG